MGIDQRAAIRRERVLDISTSENGPSEQISGAKADANVRDAAAIDAEFVASVKEHGVLTPIAAVRGRDGVVRVRAGQRRTLAAREAGLPTVPVYVRPAS